MKFTATRKPETVEAIEFDGANQAYLERELERHTGRKVKLYLNAYEAGAVLLLQPNGRWQTLPKGTFLRLYEIPKAQVCFDCKFYALADGAGRCTVFNEPIDSEIAAGADCDAYRTD